MQTLEHNALKKIRGKTKYIVHICVFLVVGRNAARDERETQGTCRAAHAIEAGGILAVGLRGQYRRGGQLKQRM